MRRQQDAARAARGEALEAHLQAGGETSAVVPELIPTDGDLTDATRDVRRLIRRAERAPRGPRRNKVLDDLVVAIGRLVFVERVMELDRLERAGLTPARLVVMSKIGPDDLRARLARFQGETGLEVPGA